MSCVVRRVPLHSTRQLELEVLAPLLDTYEVGLVHLEVGLVRYLQWDWTSVLFLLGRPTKSP